MLVVFNIIVLLAVLLIAYWWSNQGFFSGLLHLLAVIIAGAVAFAAWEPLTVGLLLRGGQFDNYAWGISLLVVFTLTLFLTRLALDRIAPANIDLPHAANIIGGGLCGAGAGILTVGIVLVGFGHIQSNRSIAGWVGYARSERDGQVTQVNALWLPVHELSTSFFGYLSVTSMWSPEALWHVQPRLDRQATLLRDSYGEGSGQLSLAPDAASVDQFVMPTPGQALVVMSFTSKAIDFSDQLALAQSQVRLISDASGLEQARVVHPVGFIQDDGFWKYDSYGYYASSIAGQESVTLGFEFVVPGDFTPKYIQVRGTRFRLPAPISAESAMQQALAGAMSTAGGGGDATLDPGAGGPIDDAIKVDEETRLFNISINSMPTGLSHEEGYLTGGEGTIQGRSRTSLRLRVRGFYAPEGTRIVQVRVDPRSSANIFRQSLRDSVSDSEQLRLVDAQGGTYRPWGFMKKEGATGKVTIKLDPRNYVATYPDLPFIPDSGEDELYLLFRVTIDRTITGMKFGDETVGTCSVLVEADD